MASYRKRNGRWQVQVRRVGCEAVSRTFTSKADAVRWASRTELALEVLDLPQVPDRRITIADILTRYERDVVPRKRTDSTERFMLRVIKRHPVARKLAIQVNAEDFSAFRDDSLETRRPATVLRHLRVMKHALKIACDEWGLPRPFQEIAKVKGPKVLVPYRARIKPAEVDRLLKAPSITTNPIAQSAVQLALLTGLRRGELLALRWDDVDLLAGTLAVRMSKNGRSRVIPLSPDAIAHLHEIPRDDEVVLPIEVASLKSAFQRARKQSGVSFRFHDLRHEAISRFFELGLTVPEVQLISGHRTLSQLSRYAHPEAERVARALRRVETMG